MRAFSEALLAVVLSHWLLFATPVQRVRAQADATAADPQDGAVPEGYLRAAKEGHDEYELRNYAEARARFLEAHQIYPNARSLRALGAVEYDLQNYPQSIEYLQSALASDVRPLQGALRAETEELLGRARGYVATYTIQLEPADAQLELDDERVQPRADGTLLVKVGDHRLSVSAPGHLTKLQTLHVAGGRDETLQVKLVPMPKEDGEKVQPAHKKWWVWTIVGVAAVGLAVGLGVGLSGREKEAAPTASNVPGLTSVQALRFGGL